MSTNQLQAEARALRETAQQCLTKAEALEASLAATQTPRPYYYGQEIQGSKGHRMRLRMYAVCELFEEVGYMFDDGSCSFRQKSKLTHLDGTPLGEFRMVPSLQEVPAWPNNEYRTTPGWRLAVNETLLNWRLNL